MKLFNFVQILRSYAQILCLFLYICVIVMRDIGIYTVIALYVPVVPQKSIPSFNNNISDPFKGTIHQWQAVGLKVTYYILDIAAGFYS